MKKQIQKTNRKKDNLSFLSAKTCIPLVLCLLLCLSCKDDKQPERYLTVEPLTVEFLNVGGSKTVTVETNFDEWTYRIDAADNWVTAERNSNSIVLTASINSANTERSATLLIVVGSNNPENKTIDVLQGLAHLTVTPEASVVMPRTAGVFDVTVSTNVDNWDYALETNDWLTATKTSSGIRLTATENTGDLSRGPVNLSISANEFGFERIIAVMQEGTPNYDLRLNAPVDNLVIDDFFVNATYPLTFTWDVVTGVSEYMLKFSTDPDFPEGAATYTVNIENGFQYAMNANDGITMFNSFPKQSEMTVYWTVTPAEQPIETITTYTRGITAKRSSLIGRWLFNDATNLAAATSGWDLIPFGTGFSSIDGPSVNNKAARLAANSYFRALHGLTDNLDVYTVKLYVKFLTVTTHPLLQTNLSSTRACFQKFGAGAPGLLEPPNEIVSLAANINRIGPNQWHEIFMVSNGAAKRIYVNGELVVNFTVTNTAQYSFSPEGVAFFADNGSRGNELDVAEIAIWDKAMTEDEIHKESGIQKLNRADFSIPYFSIDNPGAVDGAISYLIDGNIESAWYSTLDHPTPHHIVIDLGANRNIGRVNVYTSTWAGSNPKTVQLFTGNDPEPESTGWTQAGEIVREGVITDYGALMMFDFPEASITCRYIKIVLPDRYGGMSVLGEVIVYEKVE